MSITISGKLAEIGYKLRYDDIPKIVIANSKKLILDTLGCILGAKEVTSSVAIVDTVNELGGNPDSTVIGYGFKTSMAMAALANGTIGHAFDMDDACRTATLHPSVVVLPAVLAVAEKYKLDGKALLIAYIYGAEVAVRLGQSFLGQTYYQGFHPTGTCGVFGASAGVAKLLELDKEKLVYAIGLAGSQAAGLLEWKAQGTWSKRLQSGHPSMCGVLSGLLAKRGYTAPTTILEGEDGFIRAYSYKDIWDLNKITDRLGEKWQMSDTSIKVQACCRFSAPLADAGLEFHKMEINPDDVVDILAKVNKYSIKVLCVPEERKAAPQNVVDAQFSLPYAIAVGMVKGRQTIDEYSAEAIKDPEVVKLAKKIRWELDPAAEALYPHSYPCTVIVKTKDGNEHISHIDFPKGDPENPVTFEEVIEKFRFMTSKIVGTNKIDRIINNIANLENINDLDVLISDLY